MTEDKQTQRTPKGAEIPIPTREEFLRNLAKVAPPVKGSDRDPDDDSAVQERPEG